ncbi:MAG: DUF503 domain-containing protein [Magnetococcales bacterium]|nr:DUF503 domain-containing protein [Magnetococcales bacterium]
MQIGSLQIRLDFPGVHSLKEKRSIVKRLMHQVRNRFEVAAAEVAHQDVWQTAGLGFVSVGNDPAHLQSRMQKIVNFIENSGEGVLVDFHLEIIS